MFTISFTQPSTAVPGIVGQSRDAGPVGVVFLHGWRRDRGDWSRVIGMLGDQLSVLTLDLPGFGDSLEPVVPIDTGGYAQAVANVIRDWRYQAQVQRVVIVGHSFGGRVAIELAGSIAPDLVDAVVLIGVPILRPRGHTASPIGYRIVRALAGLGVLSQDRLERARRRYGSEDYRNARGVMREIFVRVVAEEHLESFSTIACPIRMLWGSLDGACPVALAHQAAQANCAAVLEVLDGVHHLVPLEDPQSIADLITAIVDGS